MTREQQEKILEVLGVEEEEKFYLKVLELILTGDFTIEKIPFKPRQGEKYFYINEDAEIMNTQQYYCVHDILLMNMGNCFRTEKEAERNRELIMSKFRKMEEELCF